MKMCHINPHIRFIEIITYSLKDHPIKCSDCRLFYLLSGNAEIVIGNQTFSLEKDSLFYCCGGSEYNLKTSDSVTMIAINFDLSQNHNEITEKFIPQDITMENIPVFFDYVEDSEILNSHVIISNASYLHHKIGRILSEFSEHKIFYKDICSAILKEILISIHRNELHKSSIINEIISYIHENFSKEITNKELAELAGYHEFHLNKLFINYTGTTMHHYILNVRINEAKRLILTSDLPLSQISAQVGFNNNTYFSSYFKKITGLTPLQFKKALKNKA